MEALRAVLARHPAVAEVAVIGVPDPTWGEAVHAVITPAAGSTASADEIIAWCRPRLAGFKVPKQIVFGPLPKTSTGKIQKNLLREQARTL